MTPNLTIGYMAEQINRERLDGVAARGWLADEAAAKRPSAAGPAQVAEILGAALIRFGERIQGTVPSPGTSAHPGALRAR